MFDSAPVYNALMDFVEREAERMWASEEHRQRSVAQVMSFARFRDNLSLIYRAIFGSPFFSVIHVLVLFYITEMHPRQVGYIPSTSDSVSLSRTPVRSFWV